MISYSKLILACATLLAPASLAAQLTLPDSVAPARHTLTVSYELGRPTGWVQVRENAIAGTRLSLARDLGVHVASTVNVQLTVPAGAGAVGVSVAGTTLRGSTVLGQPVFFNGTTLQGGTVLNTRTEAGDFVRVVVDYRRRLARVGAGGELVGRAGLDATLLEFRLQGTLDPTTVGHETKEDFVTQELPAPFIGAELHLPLGGRVELRVGADGGGLPWVSSLRYEGGLVRLEQRRLDGNAGLDLALASRLRVGAALHYTSFAQHERSGEDGNQFSMSSTGVALHLAWRF
ncbi:MAG: hypothetical protein ACYCVL_07700 [Gemmatimonadaceae bacterium]